MTWKKAFKQEFGIHFKDSTGELGFAIAFIEEVEADAYERAAKELEKLAKWPDPSLKTGEGAPHVSAGGYMIMQYEEDRERHKAEIESIAKTIRKLKT